MIFPYMSPYLYMMGVLGSRQRERRPWDEDQELGIEDPAGAFGARPWNVDASTGDQDAADAAPRGLRRPGMGAGLTALGASLLEAAPRGDFGGGLARGAASFSEALEAGRERARRERMEEAEERRRQAAEGRAESAETRAAATHDLGMERGNEELGVFREQREQGQELRARTGKSAETMVAEIEALAAQNPGDPKLQTMAKRAAGYALGDDSDLDKLAGLHEQMTGEAYYDRDVDRKTGAEIRSRREMYGAGVEVDPVEQQRRENARADEQLVISRGHLGVAEKYAAGGGRGGRTTPLQVYKEIDKKVKAKVEAKVRNHADTVGTPILPGMMDRWRDEAEWEAEAEIQSQMDAAYEFTETGELKLVR